MQSEHLNNTKVLTLVFIGTSLFGIFVNVMIISYQVFSASWDGIWNYQKEQKDMELF
jgi:hypothetical protein